MTILFGHWICKCRLLHMHVFKNMHLANGMLQISPCYTLVNNRQFEFLFRKPRAVTAKKFHKIFTILKCLQYELVEASKGY